MQIKKEKDLLTAKEWLEKDLKDYKELILAITDTFKVDKNAYLVIEGYMERYASYKTKVLEDRILEFRNNIKDKCSIWENFDTSPSLSEQYDKHFNITTE